MITVVVAVVAVVVAAVPMVTVVQLSSWRQPLHLVVLLPSVCFAVAVPLVVHTA